VLGQQHVAERVHLLRPIEMRTTDLYTYETISEAAIMGFYSSIDTYQSEIPKNVVRAMMSLGGLQGLSYIISHIPIYNKLI